MPFARVITIMAAATAVVFAVMSVPRLATARTLESIRSAIKGKVMHTRMFMVDQGQETLSLERWTDGVRRREESLSYTNVSDGSVELLLNHQHKTADLTNDAGYKYAPSGFDIDSILADMTRSDDSGVVTIETLKIDGVDKLVVEFRGKLADYAIQCNPETRLPESMKIEPTSSLSPDKAPVLLRFDYLNDAGDLFSTSVPEGYKVYDLRKGFDPYVTSALIELPDSRFKLFRLDINDNGEVFALCATNAEFELDLGIDQPYAGPVRLESLDKKRQPTIAGMRGHFLAWVVPSQAKADLQLTIRYPGQLPITKLVRAQQVDGKPDYYALASHILWDRVDVPLRDLHVALQGVRQLPEIREDGLVINATFDPTTSLLSGTVRNTTSKPRTDVAVVFKLLSSSPWASAKVVQVGSIRARETVGFSEVLATRRARGPLPLVDVVFSSIYDPSVGILISPYRRR